MIRGPRTRFKPKAPRSHAVAPYFQSEYGALVHARLHNQRRLLAGKKPFMRLTVVMAGGVKRDVDLFRDYIPKTITVRTRVMPYCVITSRQLPETKFEYAFATLEEAEAMVSLDDRLKKGRVRDFVIVSEHNKALLSRFSAPELESLYANITGKRLAPASTTVEYSKLLNEVATLLASREPERVHPSILERYRRTQRQAMPESPPAAEPKQKRSNDMAEIQTETTSRKTTAAKKAGRKATSHNKAPKKAAARPTEKASKKTSKGAPASTKGKGAKGKAAANKAASSKAGGDPLGRPGTLSRFIADQIMAGKSNEAASKAAQTKFPDSSSTEPKHVAWLRWKLGTKGVKVPDAK